MLDPKRLTRRQALLLAAGLLAGCGHAPIETTPFDHTFPSWNAVLARFVTDQGVDYAGLKQDPGSLSRAIAAMQAVTRRNYNDWSRPQQMAFLINAHNAFAIQRILDFYPVQRLDDTQWLGSAREAKFIRLLDDEVSLKDLSERVMSDKFRDARAIFLLNWACRGCAPLAPVAATAANLSDLLERQTRRLLADPRYCVYDQVQHTVTLSPLFDWYSDHFQRDYTTLWVFLEHYLPPEQAALLRRHAPRIRIMPFDDTVNSLNPMPTQ